MGENLTEILFIFVLASKLKGIKFNMFQFYSSWNWYKMCTVALYKLDWKELQMLKMKEVTLLFPSFKYSWSTSHILEHEIFVWALWALRAVRAVKKRKEIKYFLSVFEGVFSTFHKQKQIKMSFKIL